MKILVDANVIIDALTGREPFRKNAEQIFLIAANQIEDMYIIASSATDIYYLVRKHLKSTDQAKKILIKLYDLFQILDVTSTDCKEALSSKIKDYEDAIVSHCAERNQLDYIVTRNTKDYGEPKTKAILPHEFLEIISRNSI